MDFKTYWRLNRNYEKNFDFKSFTPNQTQRVRGLSDILLQEDIRLVLLDSYGVLNTGETVIEEAVQAVRYMKEQGLAVHLVSNDARFPSHTRVEHYRGWGYPFLAKEMFNSFDTMIHAMEKELAEARREALWGVVDLPALHRDHPVLKGRVQHIAENPENLSAISYLMVMENGGDGFLHQEALCAHLKESGGKLWLANPDIGVRLESGFIPTPGFYAAQLLPEGDTQKHLRALGKPFPDIFELAIADYAHLRPEQILMVGDTLHTDILGARNMGFKSLLVESGVYFGMETEALISETGITPDYLAPLLRI